MQQGVRFRGFRRDQHKTKDGGSVPPQYTNDRGTSAIVVARLPCVRMNTTKRLKLKKKDTSGLIFTGEEVLKGSAIRNPHSAMGLLFGGLGPAGTRHEVCLFIGNKLCFLEFACIISRQA